jgi:hypothetical protein
VAADGTIRLEGIALELWDGARWTLVEGEPADLSLSLHAQTTAAAQLTGLSAPAGEYSRMRLTADAALVDLDFTLSGLRYSAAVESGLVTVERDIQAGGPDANGAITLTLTLETIRTIAVTFDAGGAALVAVDGDFGPASGPARMPGRVLVGDVSSPAVAPGVQVRGTVSLSGVGVELWNGADWVAVTGGSPAIVSSALGAGAATATLVPLTDLAAGTYTRTRLTITAGVLDLAITVNGREYTTSVEVGREEPLVIEKEVEVVVNEDGTRTIRVAITALQQVSVLVNPGTGAPIVEITGDLGPATASATAS